MSCVRVVLLSLLLIACAVGCQSRPVIRSTATAVPTAATAGPAAASPEPITPTSLVVGVATPSETSSAGPGSVASVTPSLEAAAATPTVEGAIGTLFIPALDRTVAIVPVGWRVEEVEGFQVAVWETVNGAAGYHRGSAPLGGDGNCVLSGHSSLEHGAVFEGLWGLTPGDTIYLTDNGSQEYRYVVASVNKVQETGASLENRLAHAAAMDPTGDARLTLVTCWPDWAYTHRVIVVAQRDSFD